MITEDYVSFETAKLLKEKGFNEPCRLYYDKYHGYVPIFVEDSKLKEYGYKELVRNDQNSISDFVASAPSLYVAMKWLREEKGVAVIPVLSSVLDNEKFLWDIKIVVAETYDTYSQGWVYEKQEAACEAAIKYCLESLI